MLQPARNVKSKSLLREAATCVLCFKDGNIEEFFQQKINSMVLKRNDAFQILTGEKNIKTDLLSYLEQKGEVMTANIWCRNLVFEELNQLRAEIKSVLNQNGVEGIVEIHLQDREINSPHIQFVGNNAKFAEELIADIVVRRNYEPDLQNAVGRDDFIPAYLYESNQVIKTDEMAANKSEDIKEFDIAVEQEKKREIRRANARENIKKYKEQLRAGAEEFKKIMSDFSMESFVKAKRKFGEVKIRTKQEKRSFKRQISQKNDEELLQSFLKRKKFKHR